MATFPPFCMDAVVAVGAADADGDVSWMASGFLYGFRVAARTPRYLIYLVTNRHVFEGSTSVVLRFNPRGKEPAREYQLALCDAEGRPEWVAHSIPSVDVAVVPINYRLLRRHAMQVAFFASDVHAVRIPDMRNSGVAEGDLAFVLGFPMGIVGGRRNVVIVRSGAVARIGDLLRRSHRDFLLDVFVFPGNSGGPVLLEGDSSHARLVGIVKSYVSYQDVAVSVQTQRPRVIFEENSGLAAAHPVDAVEQAIRAHLRSRRPLPRGCRVAVPS